MPSSEFMNSLVVTSVSFRLDRGQEISGQASGRLRVKNLRPAMWRATLGRHSLNNVQFKQAMALLENILDELGTFYVWNPVARYPKSDPTGSILGVSAVKTNSLNADNKRISLKGLPAGYVLTRGDMLSFAYGAGPSRALHMVVDASVVANGSGVTSQFYVTPHILTGAAVDDVVDLKKPAAEMMLVPGSFDPSTIGRLSSISLEAIQVL